ncbi:MAG TPA: VOC family protein [bacterium]|nr:VOC family protein [bacterium]
MESFKAVIPVLSVDDLTRAVEYYRDVLGFQLGWTWGDPPYIASVCRDGVELMLGQRGKAGPRGVSHVYFQTSGVDVYYERLTKAGAAVTETLENRSYGMRDFGIADPSGNRLDFGSVIDGS